MPPGSGISSIDTQANDVHLACAHARRRKSSPPVVSETRCDGACFRHCVGVRSCEELPPFDDCQHPAEPSMFIEESAKHFAWLLRTRVEKEKAILEVFLFQRNKSA